VEFCGQDNSNPLPKLLGR
jgi:hypothetical protein